MFAPDQEKTAAELLRVTKPGGRIGMANWTPDGGVGQMFLTVAKHTGGLPPGMVPPVLWGTEDRLRELFGAGISELRIERLKTRQVFRSPDHYLDFFRTYFGPIKTAYEQVGPVRPHGSGQIVALLIVLASLGHGVLLVRGIKVALVND